MKSITPMLLLLFCLLPTACFAQTDLPTLMIPAEAQESFKAYLAAHSETPEEYVVGKFRDHDIVFVGEQHHFQQNLDFAQRLIPRLYAAGIYNLGWEFANSEDQPAIDRLLNAPTWNQLAAEQILWKCYNLPWVSTGYLGTLHAAWQLNHGLKPGAHRFRIVGINIQSRPVSKSQLLPGEVPTDHPVHSRLLGLSSFDAINIHMAEVISKEFIAKREKALIYCGSGHSSTRFFYQRTMTDNGLSAGNLLYDYIGERVLRLVLHSELQGGVDFAKAVESLLSDSGAAHRQVAFDIRGGPLGNVPVHAGGYLYGSKPDHQMTAGDVWDGYIYLGPLSERKKDTFIASFITPQNFLRLRESWELFSPTEKANNAEELVRIIQSK